MDYLRSGPSQEVLACYKPGTNGRGISTFAQVSMGESVSTTTCRPQPAPDLHKRHYDTSLVRTESAAAPDESTQAATTAPTALRVDSSASGHKCE